METFNEDFLRHHAEKALAYVRLVEKEARRSKQVDRVWFRDWQSELSKSTLIHIYGREYRKSVQ